MTMTNIVRQSLTYMAAICLIMCGCSADRDGTLDRAEKQLRPIVEALESFREANGRYPTTLVKLVEDDVLTEIPVIPEVRGTHGVSQPKYDVAPDGSMYCLWFTYDFPDGIGPAEFITRYYISDDSQWHTASFPPSFPKLLARRFGKRFQNNQSSSSLSTTVNALIEGHSLGNGCVNLFDSQIIDCLGLGEEVTVPMHLHNDEDEKAIRYSAHDDGLTYVFVLMNKRMPGGNANGSISDRDFVVTRVIYQLDRMSNNETDWKVVSECR